MVVKMLARLAAVFVFMLTAGSAAYAQRTVLEQSLSINATVSAVCQMNIASPGAMTIAPGGALSAVANGSVTCSNGTEYTVAIGNGDNFANGKRRLKHTNASLTQNNFIEYDLTPVNIPTRGNGVVQSFTLNVAGTVPAAAEVGSYTDTVRVSLTY